MKDIIESIEYKGYKINIYPDYDAETPDKWENDDLFLVGFHRDFTVENDLVSERTLESIFNGGKYSDDSIDEGARDIMKRYHVFGLEAYIHSGVVLALSKEGNFPDRQWDVSQLGAVFVSKKEAKSRKEAYKLALGLIESWNIALSGQVYGYMIEDKDGNGDEFGGCWGFYGDYAESGLIEEAKGEIDSEIENEKKNGKELFLKYWVSEAESVKKWAKRLVPKQTEIVNRNLTSIQRIIEKS